MYRVKIVTTYNTIELIVDDVNSPEVKEILNQPYVKEVYIETMNHYTKEERDELLSHVVGMTYRTEKALEMTKKMRKDKE